MPSTFEVDSITAITTDSNITIKGKGSGKVSIGDGNLLFPDSDGSSGQIIKTNGSGALSFTTSPADNSIDSDQYVDGSIDTAHYAAGSVDATALGADAVTAAKIGDNVLNSEHYAAGSIDNEHIADDAIDSEHYADGSIDNAHIADDAIDSEHYAAGSIDTAHIGDLQVTTGKIAADAITSAKIADDAIDSEHYTDGSIDNAHIADDAIDSEHYAAGSIDTAHIADDAVTLAKIASSTIVESDENNTFTKSQRGSITALSDGSTITPNLADNNHYSVTLAGNRNLANPSNIVAGQSGSMFITQDGTGSRTLSYGGYWKFPAGTAPTLTTTAAAVDRIDYVVRTTTSIHAVATLNVS